jgi:hypothetical protein
VFDVTKATLDEIGVEIDKTLNKLGRLQALYAAAQKEDQQRIEKLIEQYRKAQREEVKRREAEAEKEATLEMSNT